MSSELAPLLASLDLLVQDAAPAPGQGIAIRASDYPALSEARFDEVVEQLQKVQQIVRLLDAHRPCLYRAVKLWAGWPEAS